MTPPAATTSHEAPRPPPPAEPAGAPVPPPPLDATIVDDETEVPPPPGAPHAAAPQADPGREAAVGQVVDMAIDAWRLALDDVESKTGKRMFPDEFIAKIWRPAAMRLGIKYMPEVNQDLTDLVTIAMPVGATVVVVRKLSKLPPRPNGAVGAPPAPKPDAPKPDAAPKPTPTPRASTRAPDVAQPGADRVW